MRSLAGLFLVLILIGGSYVNVLHGEFQFDDYSIVSEDFHILQIPRDILTIKGFFTRLLTADRPVTKLTFWFSYAIGGPEPWAFHLINILIHLSGVVVVYLFSLVLFKDLNFSKPEPLSLAVAALWGVHPIQTEAVSYIVQRSESLASVFYLLGFLAFLKAVSCKDLKNTLIWFLGGLGAFVLSWGSKPIAVTIPAAFLVYVFSFRPKHQRKRAIMLVLPLFIIGIISGIAILIKFKGSPHVGFDIKGISSKDYLLTQLVVLINYLRLIFVPIGQSVDHDFPVYHSLIDLPVLASLVFWLVLLGVPLYAVIKGKVDWDGRVISFGLLWFVIVLSPTSSLVPLRDLMVEHRVYLAMLGIVLATVVVLKRILPEKVFYILCALIVSTLAIVTYQRNFLWQSKFSLWADAAAKAPYKARVHNNLGKAYLEKGRLSDAEREFLTAINLDPAHVSSYNNLSNIYLKQGRYQKAADYALMALHLQPEYVQARINLGTAYYYLKDFQGAIQQFLMALERMPNNPGLYSNIGALYAEIGEYKKAEEYFLKALALKPDFLQAYINMGIMYIHSGQTSKAIDALRRVLTLNPQNPKALYFITLAYKKIGNDAMARNYYEILKRLNPSMAKQLEPL